MDRSTVSVGQLTEERLDAHYYGSRFIANANRLAICGLTFQAIGQISDKCNCGATPVDVQYGNTGQGLIRTSDVRPNLFNAEGVLRTMDITVAPASSIAALSGDLLFTMSGTIGYAAVIPDDSPEVFSFSNTIARVRFAKLSPYDARFMATFFNSRYGHQQSLRLTSGGIQGHVMPNPFKKLLVPTPHKDVQAYIGDKVRQAERLRTRARTLEAEIARLIAIEQLQQAMDSPNQRTNRVRPNQMEPRLDAKFYSPRAMRVFLAALACDGVRISNLKPKIRNGFEHRTFVNKGQAYVTVSQVSSLRLDLSNVPRISESVRVPEKAQLSERCILAVRSGATIGTVVKVHSEDLPSCASSDLVIMEFPSSEIAACVALFLNSDSGRCLQQKVIYGGVIPKISQDDLLTLPIPKIILDLKEVLLSTHNSLELALRNARRLTTAAKLLVEGLIDGHVSEADLQAAHADRDADRAILRRLTAKGLDVAGEPPLFPDLAPLEKALADAGGPTP